MKFQDFKDKRVVFFVAETKPSVTGFGLSAFNFASALNQFGYKTKIVCYNYNNKYKKSEKIDHVIIKRIVYFNYNLFTKIFSFPWLVVKYLIYVITSEITLVYGRYLIGYEFVLLFSILFNKYSVFRSTLLGEDDIESKFLLGNFFL